MPEPRIRTGDGRVAATFDDLATAERAVADLRGLGVEPERVRLHHGAGDQDFGTGRTGAKDDELASRMVSSFMVGALTGTVVGLALGAVLGGLAFRWFSAAWLGSTIAAGVAGGGLGALWGFMGGFRHRAERTRSLNDQHAPSVADEVTVTVDVADPADIPRIEESLHAHGGG